MMRVGELLLAPLDPSFGNRRPQGRCSRSRRHHPVKMFPRHEPHFLDATETTLPQLPRELADLGSGAQPMVDLKVRSKSTPVKLLPCIRDTIARAPWGAQPGPKPAKKGGTLFKGEIVDIVILGPARLESRGKSTRIGLPWLLRSSLED